MAGVFMLRSFLKHNRYWFVAFLTTLFVMGVFYVGGLRGTPELSLESSRLDFGIISNSTPTTKTMIVRNIGNAPLKTYSVSSTCSCTTGTMTPAVLKPGAQGTLNITVNPAKFLGFESVKTLLITSNAKPVTVETAFRIEPEVILEPPVLEMGKIAMGASPSGQVVIRQAGKEPIAIKSVVALGKETLLHVSMMEKKASEWRIPGRAEYVITVNLSPDAPSGPFTESFWINGVCARLPKLNYNVTGEIVAPYTVKPHVVTCGKRFPGEAIPNAIRVSAESAFQLTDLVVPEVLSAEITPGPQMNSHEIQLKLLPDTPLGFNAIDVWFSVQINGKTYRDRVRVNVLVDANPPS